MPKCWGYRRSDAVWWLHDGLCLRALHSGCSVSTWCQTSTYQLSQTLIAGVYSHMLSQMDTQWYHTRPFQLFQGLFSWYFLIHGPYHGSFTQFLLACLPVSHGLLCLGALGKWLQYSCSILKILWRQKYQIFGKEWKSTHPMKRICFQPSQDILPSVWSRSFENRSQHRISK